MFTLEVLAKLSLQTDGNNTLKRNQFLCLQTFGKINSRKNNSTIRKCTGTIPFLLLDNAKGQLIYKKYLNMCVSNKQ